MLYKCWGLDVQVCVRPGGLFRSVLLMAAVRLDGQVHLPVSPEFSPLPQCIVSYLCDHF